MSNEIRELNDNDVECVSGGGIVDDSVSPRFVSLRTEESVFASTSADGARNRRDGSAGSR